MPKQKTHKGLKKVLTVAKSGFIKRGKVGGSHNTGKKSAKHNRNLRKGSTLSAGDKARFKKLDIMK